MNKKKKLISHRILRTELHCAIEWINGHNFGLAKDILETVLKRVDEYELINDGCRCVECGSADIKHTKQCLKCGNNFVSVEGL